MWFFILFKQPLFVIPLNHDSKSICHFGNTELSMVSTLKKQKQKNKRDVILFRSDLFKNKTATVSPYKPGTQNKMFKQPIKKSNSTVYSLKPELTEMQTQKQTKKIQLFVTVRADHDF